MTHLLADCAIAFISIFITDVCWAFYIKSVKDNQAVASAMWAVFLFVAGAVGTLSYVKNAWLLIPAAAGAAVGTYVTVRYNKGSK